jgi:uncharacterized protein YkwD
MLKNLNKHLHTNPILISILSVILIFTIVALPLLLNKNNKDSSDTSRFLKTISSSAQISSTSSSSSFVNSVSLSSVATLPLQTSQSSVQIPAPEPETKVIQEVKPVFIQPIEPLPIVNIEPQNNLEETFVIPKPTIKETPLPIIQSTQEPKQVTQIVTSPTPEIESPKPIVDNAFISTSCDQNLANQMLNIVNSHRVANGAKELALSGQLIGIACAHSQWMTATGIFSHTGRDGTTPFQRCKNAGSYCYAENVAYNTIPNIQDLFDQFKNSPGHNLNMLDPNFVEIGIAFDGVYVTQVFR